MPMDWDIPTDDNSYRPIEDPRDEFAMEILPTQDELVEMFPDHYDTHDWSSWECPKCGLGGLARDDGEYHTISIRPQPTAPPYATEHKGFVKCKCEVEADAEVEDITSKFVPISEDVYKRARDSVVFVDSGESSEEEYDPNEPQPEEVEVGAYCPECDWEGKCLVSFKRAEELERLGENEDIGENDFCGCHHSTEWSPKYCGTTSEEDACSDLDSKVRY